MRRHRGIVITHVTGRTIGEFDTVREAREFIRKTTGERRLRFEWYIERNQPYFGFTFRWKT